MSYNGALDGMSQHYLIKDINKAVITYNLILYIHGKTLLYKYNENAVIMLIGNNYVYLHVCHLKIFFNLCNRL